MQRNKRDLPALRKRGPREVLFSHEMRGTILDQTDFGSMCDMLGKWGKGTEVWLRDTIEHIENTWSTATYGLLEWSNCCVCL